MIVPDALGEEHTYRSAVTLSHYAKAVQYSECAIYGVSNPAEARTIANACREIWTLEERNYALRYLTEAQIELENETLRLFNTAWITGVLDAPNERLTDVKTYNRKTYFSQFLISPAIYTRWTNVKALGRLVPVEIDLNVAVDHTADPAVITATIDPLIVTDKHRIRIFESGNYGTDREISLDPSSISIVDVDLTITIPRCRTVKYELRDNPSSGLDYTNIDNFIEEVDIYYYTTVNTDSMVITKSNCSCSTRQEAVCLEFATLGTTTVRSSTRCRAFDCTCNSYDIHAGLYYEAGESIPNQQVIDMIIRLAHVKMPLEPCGCEIAQRLYKRDREIPAFLLPERLKCPFGVSDGAWISFQWARTLKKRKFGHM